MQGAVDLQERNQAKRLKKRAEYTKFSNNLTILRKVYIYKFYNRVYYCIHVERKEAPDALFAFFLRV